MFQFLKNLKKLLRDRTQLKFVVLVGIKTIKIISKF